MGEKGEDKKGKKKKGKKDKEKAEKKKAAKIEREKIKKAELKAAGKLLTPAQKQAKLRAESMLEARRAQGVDVPTIGEKRTRPGTRKRPNKKNRNDENSESSASDNE